MARRRDGGSWRSLARCVYNGCGMKLSKKSEYACLALIELARHHERDMVKIEELSDSNRIPRKFLEQILLILKGAGYLKSRRGAEGGYRLARPPDQISVAEILRLMDGALAPTDSVSKYFYEETPISSNVRMLELFRDIRDYIAARLEQTTFADLV